jgi:LysR family transcriptional regulator, cys regulon transcriptional activator
MNLQQLRCIREIVRQDFNLTNAAHALFTSQPAVSKTVMDFEADMGFDVFIRHGKRIKGLTNEGERILPAVEKILQDLKDLRDIADETKNPNKGHLTIATTHTQARYALPRLIQIFRQEYPEVRLSLLQGTPAQITQMVLSNQADVAIATEGIVRTEGLTAMPCYEWQHKILLPLKHPLTKLKKITLAELARYPLVTYDPAFAGRGKIDAAFAKEGVQTDIVLEAIDADVIRTYVEVGLGVGIMAAIALDAMGDELAKKQLVAMDAGHLFGVNTTYAAVKTDRYLKEYEQRFFDLLANLSFS